MDERQTKKLQTIPLSLRAKFVRAWEGKSLRAAINAQCLDCCGMERSVVSACADTCCPLWTQRPYQNCPDEVTGTEDTQPQNEPETTTTL